MLKFECISFPTFHSQSIRRFVCAVRLTSPYKCITNTNFFSSAFAVFKRAEFTFLCLCGVVGWLTTIILRDPFLLPILPPPPPPRRFVVGLPRLGRKVGTPTNSENARRRQCSSFKAFHFAISPLCFLQTAASVCLNFHPPRDRFCPHFQQIVRLRRNLCGGGGAFCLPRREEQKGTYPPLKKNIHNSTNFNSFAVYGTLFIFPISRGKGIAKL